MKRAYRLLPLLILLPPLAGPVLAGDDTGTQVCYGYARVAYDMVINSRLGIPPDHVVGLAERPAATAERRYSTPVLKIVLGAYLWHGEPDEYAAQVMSSCFQHAADLCLDTG
jgi:hypothetical protein